jgi:hypothetical protein
MRKRPMAVNRIRPSLVADTRFPLLPLLTLGLCLAFTAVAEAQTPEDLKIRRLVLGTELGEVATSVLEMKDGGLLIAGYEYDTWDGEWDALTLRVGTDGKQIWRHSSERAGHDYAWVVRKAKENRFVVVGTLPIADGNTAGYMECIDGDGKRLWLRTYGGPKNEILWAAEKTADGGFVLAGQTNSQGAGALDFYIVRTDSEGHEIWSRTYGGPATDRAFGIDVSPDGGALVAGFQGENPNTMNMLLLQLDPEGQEACRWTLAGNRFDVGHDVLRLPERGFVVSGYTSSFGPGDQDGFLMGLSPDCRMLWMNTYGDAAEDRVLHTARMPDGGFVLVGYSKHDEGDIWDMVIRRVDPHGSLLWSHRSFGAVGKDVIVGRDGTIFAVGGVRNAPAALEDILVLQLGPETTTH